MTERVQATVRDGDSPSLGQIADVFTRYGNFTLGGGSATTAVIHRELVEKRHWLSDDRFALSYALARLTPGTNVLAFCVGVGWMFQRLPGALVALLAASIPCTLMVIVLTVLFRQWQEVPVVQAALHGAIAAAVAITAKTSWTIARPHYLGGAQMRVLVIGAVAFGLYVLGSVPPVEVLLLAAAVGVFLPIRRK